MVSGYLDLPTPIGIWISLKTQDLYPGPSYSISVPATLKGWIYFQNLSVLDNSG
jgi:hypothetical protein